MKLKKPFDINTINKINETHLNKIKLKQKNLDIDFFHNKLLNNIFEINNFENNFISLSKCNSQKEKRNIKNFSSSLKRINSAIMYISKVQNNENTDRFIRSNNIFNKSKSKLNLFNNEIHKKIQNKTINEENKLLKSTIYNFPDNINSIKKKNSRIFHRLNKSHTKEDEKCNKMSKYVNILEKKMKEKLKQISNFDDDNYCKLIKINNKNNNSKNSNKIFFDIYKINKLNKFSNKIENFHKSNSTCQKNNFHQNSKINLMINTLFSNE